MYESKEFKHRLCRLINECSVDTYAKTPDFILTKYLMKCIDNYAHTTQMRHEWFYTDKEDEQSTGS